MIKQTINLALKPRGKFLLKPIFSFESLSINQVTYLSVNGIKISLKVSKKMKKVSEHKHSLDVRMMCTTKIWQIYANGHKTLGGWPLHIAQHKTEVCKTGLTSFKIGEKKLRFLPVLCCWQPSKSLSRTECVSDYNAGFCSLIERLLGCHDLVLRWQLCVTLISDLVDIWPNILWHTFQLWSKCQAGFWRGFQETKRF